MYTAPIKALAGEIFGKNKSALLGTVVVPSAAWLAATAYMRNVPGMGPGFGTPFGFVLLVVIALQLGALFAYADLTASGKSTGFPKHILLLPAPTWLLALVPIVTGSVFISGFVLLWLRFLSGVPFDWTQQLVLTAAITSVMCWIQAMSWELLPRSMRLVVLLAVVITTILSVISALARERNVLFGRSGGAIGLVLAIVGGYGLAYLAVIRSRRGETFDPAAALRRLFLPSAQSLRKVPLPALPTAVAAQDWFEWRVHGRILPWFMIIIGAFPLVAVVFAGIGRAPTLGLATVLVAVFYVIVSPMMGAVYISKDMTRRVQMGTFAATRPLSDVELAFAKLRLSLRSYLLSMAIVFALIAIIILTGNNMALYALWSRMTAQLGTTGSCLSLLLLLGSVTAASWSASALFMSLQLLYEAVDRKKHGWKLSIITLALFFLLLAAARRAYETRDSLLPWLRSAHTAHVEVMILPILLAAAVLCLQPRFRRVAAPGSLRALAPGFLAMTLLGLAMLWHLPLPFGYRWALSSGLVSLALVTFMPCQLVPILVGMSRHR